MSMICSDDSIAKDSPSYSATLCGANCALPDVTVNPSDQTTEYDPVPVAADPGQPRRRLESAPDEPDPPAGEEDKMVAPEDVAAVLPPSSPRPEITDVYGGDKLPSPQNRKKPKKRWSV